MAANRVLMEAARGLITCQATKQANGNDTYDALYGRSVRGSVAREGKYTRPARCHVMSRARR